MERLVILVLFLGLLTSPGAAFKSEDFKVCMCGVVTHPVLHSVVCFIYQKFINTADM